MIISYTEDIKKHEIQKCETLVQLNIIVWNNENP